MLKEQILNTDITDNQAAIWYLGQESMLVKCKGKYLLFDPYLSDYVDRVCSSEEIVWKRRYGVPIDPSELDFVDYVFLSHDHEDHCDPDTLTPFAKANNKAKYFAPPNAKGTLNRCGNTNPPRLPCRRYQRYRHNGIWQDPRQSQAPHL